MLFNRELKDSLAPVRVCLENKSLASIRIVSSKVFSIKNLRPLPKSDLQIRVNSTSGCSSLMA